MVEVNLESTLDVPGFLATCGAPETSDRYKFISTQHLVERMHEHGYRPRQAFHSRSRIHNPLYTRHCVRFSKHARELNQETPEIVMFNSHDGKSSALFTSGIFRLVCSNGMVICSEQYDSFRIPHRGYKAGKPYINHVISQVTNNLDRGMETMYKWKSLSLPLYHLRKQFYKEAMNTRFPSHLPEELATFDMPQRNEDAQLDMWTTFNRVQEYIMNGGFTVTHTEGKKPRISRELTSVDKLQKVNENLWKVTEEFVGANW